MRIDEALANAAAALRPSSDTPELDARLLLQHALGEPHEYIIAHGGDALADEKKSAFDALVKRRAAHEPLAHILGVKDFWRDTFFVTRDTLIPRPDSETLIEAALKYFPEKNARLRVLDLGTGSGCLLLSVLREYAHAHGVGGDISAETLAIAQKNARALGMEERAEFMQANWCDGLKENEMFDIILCNPPYISASEMQTLAPNVLNYEPHGALTDHGDGLKFYRELFECLPKHMGQASVVLFEVGNAQADMVSDLATKNGFQTLSIEHDIAGIARAVCVQRNNQK